MKQLSPTEAPDGISEVIAQAGGQAALAAALSEDEPITPQAVSLWVKNGFVPPPRKLGERNRILDIERRYGVHRHFLNPSVYPERPGRAA